MDFINKYLRNIKFTLAVSMVLFLLITLGKILYSGFTFNLVNVFYVYSMLCIALSVYLFYQDKQIIESGNERFHGDNLFFRYGRQLGKDFLPLPIKNEWGNEESAKLGDEIMYSVHDHFISNFGDNPLNGKQLVNIISVTDSDLPSDSRGFVKISFTGRRGAIFSRFVTYNLVGNKLVLSKFVYLLGIVQWYDKFFFFIFSPFTLPFWIRSWIKKEYSIYSSIAGGIDNSFEIFDINAYLSASSNLISDSIIEELEKNDLLSSEQKMVIYQTLNDYSTRTNNFSFGGIQFNGDIANNSIIGQIK